MDWNELGGTKASSSRVAPLANVLISVLRVPLLTAAERSPWTAVKAPSAVLVPSSFSMSMFTLG